MTACVPKAHSQGHGEDHLTKATVRMVMQLEGKKIPVSKKTRDEPPITHSAMPGTWRGPFDSSY